MSILGTWLKVYLKCLALLVVLQINQFQYLKKK